MPSETERFELRIERQTLEDIDDWISEQPDLPSRSHAIRKLVTVGLKQSESSQRFEIARFNLISTAMSEDIGNAIPGSYAYAWSEGVYPLFDQGATLHQPFSEHFTVTEEMVEELAKFLDERELDGDTPSFYELEDYYKVRTARTPWDRMQLIHTCRYMYLRSMWNPTFWAELLRGSDHPSEAKSITGDFDRRRDLYLC